MLHEYFVYPLGKNVVQKINSFQLLNSSFEYFQLGNKYVSPKYLQYLNVHTITNAACSSRHKTQRFIYNETICTSAPVGHGTCWDDKGNPLVFKKQLIGVMSWFEGCGRGLPDGYTGISSFVPWIQQVSGVIAV